MPRPLVRPRTHAFANQSGRCYYCGIRAGNVYVNRNTIGAVVGVQPFGGDFDYRDEFFRIHEPYSRERVRVLLSIDAGRTDVGPRGSWAPERADAILAPTPKVKRLLSDWGVERPVHVLPTGVDRSIFRRSASARQQLRREHDIRPCVGATYCLDRIYEGHEALCIHNPSTGREAEQPHRIDPAPVRKKVVIVGCGTSWHAALIGEYMIEEYVGIPVEVEYASEFRYRNPVIDENLADPAVIRHDGTYYLYATGEVDGDNGYRVYMSADLVNWKRGPVVFRPGQRHVAARARHLAEGPTAAYAAIKKIKFDGAQYRRDIGFRVLKPKPQA